MDDIEAVFIIGSIVMGIMWFLYPFLYRYVKYMCGLKEIITRLEMEILKEKNRSKHGE